MAPKFSLQNVLDVRHGKVELLEIDFSKLLSAQHEMEMKLSSLQEFQRNLLDQLKDAQLGEMDLSKISLLRLNIVQVNSYIENVSLDLARINRAVQEKKIELIKAKQSEETLEILKRKRHEVYLAEQVQIESRAQDDIYIAQAFRNQQQGA
jgi:Flagellar biosynthesis chaperone